MTGEVKHFPISPEVLRRLDDKDGPDAPVERDRKRGDSGCRHKKVTLEVGPRCLRCQDCEEVIDPINWIAQLVHEWEGYVWRWRSARDRVRAAEREMLDVERKLKNAKARLRRARATSLYADMIDEVCREVATERNRYWDSSTDEYRRRVRDEVGQIIGAFIVKFNAQKNADPG
jgi:hypothetical protein